MDKWWETENSGEPFTMRARDLIDESDFFWRYVGNGEIQLEYQDWNIVKVTYEGGDSYRLWRNDYEDSCYVRGGTLVNVIPVIPYRLILFNRRVEEAITRLKELKRELESLGCKVVISVETPGV